MLWSQRDHSSPDPGTREVVTPPVPGTLMPDSATTFGLLVATSTVPDGMTLTCAW